MESKGDCLMRTKQIHVIESKWTSVNQSKSINQNQEQKLQEKWSGKNEYV